MGLLEGIKERFKERRDDKKRERVLLDTLRIEAGEHERRIFQEEFRKNALEVAKAKAKKDAANASGLQKMRAMNRLRNLESGKRKEGFLGRLADYTQANMAKREENMKRSEEIKSVAKTINPHKPGIRKPFSGFNG